MYQHLRKTEKLQDTTRGALYRMYSQKEYMHVRDTPEDVLKKDLLEGAKRFFTAKKLLTPIEAFRKAISESYTKPEWLLWAVAPTLNQVEHNHIIASTRLTPSAPPWSS